jgi:hypothetical protein
MIRRFGGPALSRSAVVSLVLGSLIAAPVFCASFAAYSGSLDQSALIKEPQPGCDEKASSPEADVQQAGQIIPCEFQGPTAEQDDRSYLLETASPGSTMMRQGPVIAIARLNPEFVARLASAIREARQSGLPSAGIFSAYRPPAFGVGGFLDKFKSLHSYGLAVDLSGIGEPGSKEAKLWHDIAGRHGIVCPYRFDSKTEWNHCQATWTRMVLPDNPLRQTITGDGPLQLEEMFKVGSSIIHNLAAAIRLAVVGNRPEDSATIRPDAAREGRVSTSEHLGPRRWREARHDFAHGRRSGKTKTIILANNDAPHLEKSHRKTSAESHHSYTRHHSHSA